MSKKVTKIMQLNMNKEIRRELREIKQLQQSKARESVKALSAIHKARLQLDRDEKTALRIYDKQKKRLQRRQAILEGRLS